LVTTHGSSAAPGLPSIHREYYSAASRDRAIEHATPSIRVSDDFAKVLDRADRASAKKPVRSKSPAKKAVAAAVN
jgi:hypothetical protein